MTAAAPWWLPYASAGPADTGSHLHLGPGGFSRRTVASTLRKGLVVADPVPVVEAAAVAEVVAADVGARVTAVERVSGFVSNEDFLVDTAAGGYVLKAGAAADITAEAWACQRVRQEEVAAPEVFGFDPDGHRLGRPYVLLRRLAGIPCGNEDAALVEAGRQLRIVHTIHVDRFGFFKEAAAGHLPPVAPEAAWSQVFTRVLPELETLQAAAVLPAVLGERLRRAVTAHPWADTAARPGVLLHGDLHPRHVFSAGDQLTGIIDWGDAAVGDPLFDLGRTSRSGSSATDLVLRGYQADSPLSADDAAAVVFYRVLWSMLALVWEYRAGGDWFAGHLDAIGAGLSDLGL